MIDINQLEEIERQWGNYRNAFDSEEDTSEREYLNSAAGAWTYQNVDKLLETIRLLFMKL